MTRSRWDQFRLWLLLWRVGRLRRLDGVRVGRRGRPGLFWRLSGEAMRQAGEADFRQWLQDPRPQVRALGLVCLMYLRPVDLYPSLKVLSGDRALVRTCPQGTRSIPLPLFQLVMILHCRPHYFGVR